MTETMTIATEGGTEFERPRESFTPIEWRTHVLREGRRLLDLHGLQDWSIGIDIKPRRRLGSAVLTIPSKRSGPILSKAA